VLILLFITKFRQNNNPIEQELYEQRKIELVDYVCVYFLGSHFLVTKTSHYF